MVSSAQAPIPLPDPMPRAGRIALRPWELGDAPFLAGVGSDDHLRRFITAWPERYSVAVAEDWISGQDEARRWRERLDLAVIDPVSGRLLGAVGLTAFDDTHRRAELGYWTAPEERRNGVATSAARLLARWAFDALGLQRLQLLPEPVNMASVRVAEAIGAEQEGLLRDHLLIAGARRDVLIYGLLPDELAADRLRWRVQAYGGRAASAADGDEKRPARLASRRGQPAARESARRPSGATGLAARLSASSPPAPST